MNCYAHEAVAAVGVCAACRKGVCRACVGRTSPQILCHTCLVQPALLGFDYRSPVTVAGWPLIHVCLARDPVTMQPKIAKGIIAIGNVAFGGVAIGGAALGLFALGGASIGLLMAVGGAALGLGCSLGGTAFGSVALGGVAVGLKYAVGGVAVGPAVLDASHCDAAALEFVRHWLPARLASLRCP